MKYAILNAAQLTQFRNFVNPRRQALSRKPPASGIGRKVRATPPDTEPWAEWQRPDLGLTLVAVEDGAEPGTIDLLRQIPSPVIRALFTLDGPPAGWFDPDVVPAG